MTHKPNCDIYSNVGIPSAQKDESYCTCASLPNQEPVERWEDMFDEKFEGAICDGTGSFNRDIHEEIKVFISHQKALSIAEVIKELINKKEDIDQAWTRYGGGRTYGEFVRDYLEQVI